MMSDKLSVEAIEMLADDYERGMIGPRRLRQYFDYLIQQLAAANARIAELETEKQEIQTNFNLFHASVQYILSPGVLDRKGWIEGLVNVKDVSKKYREEVLSRIEKAEQRAEQAEASCAAMRLRFEKYVRENCKLIRHSVADGLGKPDDVEGKCGGYAQNGDEPHYICQECVAAYDPEDEYNENVIAAGSALLAELQRYREALEVLSKLGNGDSPGNNDGNRIAQAALEEKND